jgi:hypothetical protein
MFNNNNNNNNNKKAIYILFRNNNENKIILYVNSIFTYVKEIKFKGVILVLESSLEEYGQQVFYSHSMEKIIFLYKVLNKLPVISFIFYFKYVTVISRKTTLNSDINYYSLFTGENCESIVNNCSEEILVADKESNSNAIDLETFIYNLKSSHKFLSLVNFITLMRAYGGFFGIISFLIFILNILLLYKKFY